LFELWCNTEVRAFDICIHAKKYNPSLPASVVEVKKNAHPPYEHDIATLVDLLYSRTPIHCCSINSGILWPLRY